MLKTPLDPALAALKKGTDMELSSITSIQKRVLDWRHFLVTGTRDSELRRTTEKNLNTLTALLARCWSQGQVSDAEQREIRTLIRRLESLNEGARVRAGGQTPLKKEEMVGRAP